MQERYRMYRRSNGTYYLQDNRTGKQESLKTKDRGKANRICTARNEAVALPAMNLTLAKAYLAGKSPQLITRTWEEVMRDMAQSYEGSTRHRWERVVQSAPFRSLYKLPLIHTQSDDFLKVLRHPDAGTSTEGWLRIMHNRAQDLGWLLSPVLARRAWPRLQKKHGRAITWEEHRKLSSSQIDPEFRLYLEMLWELGGSQSDIAELHRDNVDLGENRLYYTRKKLVKQGLGLATIFIDEALHKLLEQLPAEGWLFPHLKTQSEDRRASRFGKWCRKFGFKGITLHSYRYSWAERAKTARMPEREAMHHLGHKSRSIHQHYAKNAEIVVFPLSYYEKKQQEKVIEFVQPIANSSI
jgi:integrase